MIVLGVFVCASVWRLICRVGCGLACVCGVGICVGWLGGFTWLVLRRIVDLLVAAVVFSGPVFFVGFGWMYLLFCGGGFAFVACLLEDWFVCLSFAGGVYVAM